MFAVHRRDVIGRHIAKYGAHELVLTRWIARHLSTSPVGVFIDVGANMGWHAVHAANKAAVETVVAFEPDALNASLLVQNLSINSIRNVVVFPCALGARSGVTKLHHYKSSNLGRHSLIADYGRNSTLVPLFSLDRALESLGLCERRIVVLKIDVEGYEPAVIEGASHSLARTDVVILECSPRLSRDGGLSIKDMIEQLHSYGFKAYMLENDGNLTPTDPKSLSEIEDQANVIWKRS